MALFRLAWDGLINVFSFPPCVQQIQALPAILLFATSFGMLWPAISHHTDSNFFALLTFACMVLWQDSRRLSLLFFAGVLAGVTTCFLQPKGMLLLLAVLCGS